MNKQLRMICMIACAPLLLAQAPAKGTGQAAPIKISKASTAVRAEIERLMSNDAAKRTTAAMSLSEMGDEAQPAIPYLIAILYDQTVVIGPAGVDRVRDAALLALKSRGRAAVRALLAALESEGTRAEAAWALGQLKVAEAVPRLVDLLSREANYNTRGALAEALGSSGDQRAVAALISVVNGPLEDNEYAVRNAAKGLAKLKDARAVDPLLALAKRAAGGPRSFQIQKDAIESAVAVIEVLAGQKLPSKAAIEWWEQNKSKFP